VDAPRSVASRMGRATLKEGSIWAPPPTPRPIPQRKAARDVVEWKSRRLGCSASLFLAGWSQPEVEVTGRRGKRLNRGFRDTL